LNDIEARLEKENIFTIDENDVTPDQELYLKDFFVQKVIS
jgi:polyphosphate kinase